MAIQIRNAGQWLLAIAGLISLSMFSLPVRAQEATEADVTIEQNTSVEVERTQQIERRSVEVQTVDVQTTSTSTSQVTVVQSVQTAVFQSIAQRSSIEVSRLQVVEVQQRQWSDGCLGLGGSDRGCMQAIVPGYLMTVTDGQQIWVYRTDASGSVVTLDERATQFRVAQLRVRSSQISFPDVSSNYWAARYIRELAALDILAGYPDGLYRPDAPVTRAEFAAIIRRAFQMAEVRSEVNFVDVDSDYWAAVAIEEAYQTGFLEAVNGNRFLPLAQLFRGDALMAIARGLNISTEEAALSLLSNYSDVTVSSNEARLLIAALTQQGIMVNYPNVRELDLERVATRAEVAVLIYQAMYSLGYVERIESPYVMQSTTAIAPSETPSSNGSTPERQACNQGIGNGAEGCDPGNSRPHGGSNDETGRTPGSRR